MEPANSHDGAAGKSVNYAIGIAQASASGAIGTDLVDWKIIQPFGAGILINDAAFGLQLGRFGADSNGFRGRSGAGIS